MHCKEHLNTELFGDIPPSAVEQKLKTPIWQCLHKKPDIVGQHDNNINTDRADNAPGSSNDHITNAHQGGNISNLDTNRPINTKDTTNTNKSKWSIFNWLGIKK